MFKDELAGFWRDSGYFDNIQTWLYILHIYNIKHLDKISHMSAVLWQARGCLL